MKLIAKSPLFLAVVVSLLMTGCAPSAKDKLVGKWQGRVEFDDAAVEQRLATTANNPIARAIAQKAMEAFESGTLDIELKADDSYTSSAKMGRMSKDDYGTWTIVNEQPTQATIQLTSHEGEPHQATVLFADEEVINVPFTGETAGLGAFRCTRVQQP